MVKTNKRAAPDGGTELSKKAKQPRTGKDKGQANNSNIASVPTSDIVDTPVISTHGSASTDAVADKVDEPVHKQVSSSTTNNIATPVPSNEVDSNEPTNVASPAIVEPARKDSVVANGNQTAIVEATPAGGQATSVNTGAETKTAGSGEPTAAASVAKDTAEAEIVDFGVEGVSTVLKTRILKGLEYSNAEQGLHNISKIPHSAVWGLGGNKNYVIEYGTQTRITAWVIGRLDFKAVTNNGNLLSISIKPFRAADADASNLLARRLSQPQLRADEAAYANIRASYYKSQYGAAKTFEDLLRDATDVYDKTKAPKIPLESFKLGDIVMAEVMLKKYSRKTHGQKNGDFGLSYDLQVLALLKPCSMKEHEDFLAAKESLATAAAAQTAGAVL